MVWLMLWVMHLYVWNIVVKHLSRSIFFFMRVSTQESYFVLDVVKIRRQNKTLGDGFLQNAYKHTLAA